MEDGWASGSSSSISITSTASSASLFVTVASPGGSAKGRQMIRGDSLIQVAYQELAPSHGKSRPLWKQYRAGRRQDTASAAELIMRKARATANIIVWFVQNHDEVARWLLCTHRVVVSHHRHRRFYNRSFKQMGFSKKWTHTCGGKWTLYRTLLAHVRSVIDMLKSNGLHHCEELLKVRPFLVDATDQKKKLGK